MKAPITTAQAWAVIAEAAGWNAKELPVLPEPEEHFVFAGLDWHRATIDYVNQMAGRGNHLALYTADQLQAYGAACADHAREKALEEAKQLCVDKYELRAKDGFPREASTARALSAAIEALKGK